MTRRIYQLIAIAWCVMAMPAAWAAEATLGAGQDPNGTGDTAAPAATQAAPAAVTTAQNGAGDDERLKVFGFSPLHKPQPAASPDTFADQAPAAPPAQTAPKEEAQQSAEMPQTGADQQPAAEEQATPADSTAETAPEQAAPAPAAESETPAAPASETAEQDQPAVSEAETHVQAEDQGQGDAPAATPHEAVHWSYRGAGAPQFWGDLKPEFATCGSGKRQSPIDISAATITTLPKIQFDYHATPLRVVNNGHSIQVNYQHGSAVIVDGKRYDLIQFHFHTPSEHTMGGKAYPMVAHLVHKAADGELLVVAVLMQTGDGNPLIARIWQELPSAAGQIKVADEQSVNVADLLPKDATYFTYTGSLTTPPCTEGVKWVVLSAPVTVSKAQVDKFAALFPHNARPVEPLNGRTVLFSN